MITDKDTARKRYQICKECEEFRQSTGQCKLCNCFMRIKTRFSFSDCPLGKWGTAETLHKDDPNAATHEFDPSAE